MAWSAGASRVEAPQFWYGSVWYVAVSQAAAVLEGIGGVGLGLACFGQARFGSNKPKALGIWGGDGALREALAGSGQCRLGSFGGACQSAERPGLEGQGSVGQYRKGQVGRGQPGFGPSWQQGRGEVSCGLHWMDEVWQRSSGTLSPVCEWCVWLWTGSCGTLCIGPALYA